MKFQSNFHIQKCEVTSWVEWGLKAPKSIFKMWLPADFDQSGIVDVPDALALLAEYGCQSDCLLDLDGDGQVQTSDLLDLLAQLWSGCD